MEFRWDDIRFFASLARHRRLQKAARELKVEHNTVARRLAQLESKLGMPLFLRSGEGFLPTAEGKMLLTEAARMERCAQSLSKLASGKPARAERRVRLAMIESVATEWLAPRLGELRKLQPSLRLEIACDGSLSDLREGEADIAVRALKPSGGDLIHFRLAQVAFGLYGTPEAVSDAQAGALAGKPIPLLAFPPDYNHLQSARWFQALKRRHPPAIAATSTLALLQAARAGAGIAVLPRFAAERSGGLARFDPRDVSVVTLWLVRSLASRKDDRINALAGFLKKSARGAQGLC
jgi:DNA-binding transcriptional LysR family regulator